MKLKLLLPSLLFILLVVGNCFSQGCSDAGVCTLSGFESHATDSKNLKFKNQLGFGFSFGKGDEDVSTFTPYLNFERVFCAKFSASARVTFNSASGELGDNTAALRTQIEHDELLRLALRHEDANALIVAHTRWASIGIISEPNTHPLNSEEESAKSNNDKSHW